MTLNAPTSHRSSHAAVGSATADMLSFLVDKQVFGLPLQAIHDVLDQRPLTRIPLAPPAIAGALNLRGRIITAIDLRHRLGLPSRSGQAAHMSIVVYHDDEPFTLIVDDVGDVLSLTPDRFEDNPANLDPSWRELSAGVYRIDQQGKLMLVLNVSQVLKIS